jgi:DNA repair photolyase
LPFLNDTLKNILAIVDSCADAGVKGIINFGMGVTLREGNREYFYAQLDRHFPGMKQRYIRAYGNAYELPSSRQQELMKLFHDACEAHGLWHDNSQIFRYLSCLEEKNQQTSFF